MASRREKYPDTSTFVYYNQNPKNRITTDCVCRAISLAMEQDYVDTMVEMVNLSIETGYEYTDKKCIEKYLELKGWIKCKQPRKADNTKYTGKQFCKQLVDKSENYICNIGGNHTVAIVDGKVHDIWDSTNGSIGNYWVREDM